MQSEEGKSRLAQFIRLNPYQQEYAQRLDNLLEKTPENDPLRDNLLLAGILLEANGPIRARQLLELNKEYPETDGGTEALFKLGMLNIKLWNCPETNEAIRQGYLHDARLILTSFIDKYPQSPFIKEAKSTLETHPKPE